jgi:hypothetical protein
MPILDKAAVSAAREARYRRRMDLRVTTKEEARRFVDDVGYCFLFPIQGIEMPSLWDAIAGRVIKTSPQHRGYEIERTWGWKDESLGLRMWYYGKLIRSKATLASLKFLPHFYALSENFGDYESDYLDEYRAGQLSAEARAIYEALLEHGALNAVRLRKESHLASDENKSRFDRALTELQVGLKVLPVGIAEAGAWRYAFIYEILPRWFPDIPKQAQQIERGEAHQAILNMYLHNVIAASLGAAAQALRWPLPLARATAEALAARGAVELNVKVNGIRELQMLAK